ncbi:hypothetical protein [Methanoregula formicica]|uniref:Uncharacterized protein n=1 Tax=Methanoregula formicica (strain DSM 22288 / NBRC 105244 / SMSP) TaxID=593750 RepID=L0HGN1_METFS|nr:hypothetical protein [Methanoregula formicica]AGB02219.1 hypothetical protein Metfor_1175 [Methanoregula formicica SMSP]
MGYPSRLWLLPLCIACFLVSAGCVAEVPAPPVVETLITPVLTSAPESPVVTAPLADLALQKEDLPSDYHLKDRTVTSYAGAGQVFRDLGWQQGYQVTYYRMDTDLNDITMITQEIAVYPQKTVRDAYSLKKERLLPEEDSRTDYQVPFPQTGDRSIAWREVSTSGITPIVTYTVIFTKKNVYEKIALTGTSTDYELLKSLAAIAAEKIR